MTLVCRDAAAWNGAVSRIFVLFLREGEGGIPNSILTTTNGQFQNKVQFVQDGAIALRQSLVLRDFFQRNSYKEDEMEKQLHYSMDLFSERNLIMQSRPFIESVYLFNNRDQFIKEHYYRDHACEMGW